MYVFDDDNDNDMVVGDYYKFKYAVSYFITSLLLYFTAWSISLISVNLFDDCFYRRC